MTSYSCSQPKPAPTGLLVFESETVTLAFQQADFFRLPVFDDGHAVLLWKVYLQSGAVVRRHVAQGQPVHASVADAIAWSRQFVNDYRHCQADDAAEAYREAVKRGDYGA